MSEVSEELTVSTRLHGATFQTTTTFILIAVRTSNLPENAC
jgi:hypothetical protein